MITKSCQFDFRFGRRLSIKEVAALTGASSATIYRHYQLYGGIKVSRKLLFFENKLIEALETLYASQTQEGRETAVDGQNYTSQWEEEGKGLSVEKGCAGMGNADEGKNILYLESRHGLW